MKAPEPSYTRAEVCRMLELLAKHGDEARMLLAAKASCRH